MTVEISTVRLKKIYAQPIIAIQDAQGSVKYVQDIAAPTIVTVHILELAEYIKYHDIEYKILYGLYWPTDFTVTQNPDPVGTRWSRLQSKLHEARKSAKKMFKETGEKKYDILQELIKLIMNSGYGKTIMKPQNTKTKLLPFKTTEEREEAWNWVYNQWGEIRGTPAFTDHNMILTQSSVDTSFTFPLHGTSCLAMSRKIMNTVFQACEEAKAYVYYTDTDSMFIPKLSLPQIESIYNRNKPLNWPTLIGKELGQFHSDFSKNDFCYFRAGKLECKVPYFPKDALEENIVADFMYPTRKKLYCLATSVNYTDAKTGLQTSARSITFRCKGMTKAGLLSFAAENFDDLNRPDLFPEYFDQVQRSILCMFYSMSQDRSEYQISINPSCSPRPLFIYSKSGVFTTNVPFSRKIAPRPVVEEKKEQTIRPHRQVPLVPKRSRLPDDNQTAVITKRTAKFQKQNSTN